MKFSQFIKLIIVFLSYSCSGQACDEVLDCFTGQNHQNYERLQIHVSVHQNYDDLNHFFVENFAQSYQHLPLVQLNPNFKDHNDLKAYLNRAFHSEMKLVNNVDKRLQIVRNVETQEYAALMFIEDQSAEYTKLQTTNFDKENTDHIAHIRQLLVGSHLRGDGIGRFIVQKIQAEYPTIILDTRRINGGGKLFYQRLGFVEQKMPYDHALDFTKYCGFLWQNSGIN